MRAPVKQKLYYNRKYKEKQWDDDISSVAFTAQSELMGGKKNCWEKYGLDRLLTRSKSYHGVFWQNSMFSWWSFWYATYACHHS